MASVDTHSGAAQGFDPVARTTVATASAVASRHTNGLAFYFSTEDHARTFDARPLDYLYCPVFHGSRVNPSISLEKDGQTLYFCCAACRARFDHGEVGGDGVLGLRLARHGSAIGIDGVTPGSPAAQAGLEAGMTILSVDEQVIDGLEKLIVVMESARPGQAVSLRVRAASVEERTVR